jgi:hypothetical protein
LTTRTRSPATRQFVSWRSRQVAGLAQLEHLITFQPVAEAADAERVVFVGRNVQQVGEPVSSDGIERVEWVPLESVPPLLTSGQIWNAATVVGLLSVLTRGR